MKNIFNELWKQKKGIERNLKNNIYKDHYNMYDLKNTENMEVVDTVFYRLYLFDLGFLAEIINTARMINGMCSSKIVKKELYKGSNLKKYLLKKNNLESVYDLVLCDREDRDLVKFLNLEKRVADSHLYFGDLNITFDFGTKLNVCAESSSVFDGFLVDRYCIKNERGVCVMRGDFSYNLNFHSQWRFVMQIDIRSSNEFNFELRALK